MAGTFELSDDRRNAKSLSVDLPTGGVTEGEVLQLNSGVFGFVLATVDETTTAAGESRLDIDRYTLITRAEQVTVNKDGNAILQGDPVYWSGTEVQAAVVASGLIGYANEDAGAGDATVSIDFDGGLNL